MFKKMCYVFIITAVFFLVSGCSDKEKEKQSSSDSQNTTEEDETGQSDASVKEDDSDSDTDIGTDSEAVLDNVKSIPKEISGFVSQDQGMFGNFSVYDDEKKVKEKLKKLPQMGDNASSEKFNKYLNYIYWLVARDFPNPEDMIKKWEFASFGNPDLPDSRYHFKENYNIEIILDSSGSMAAVVDGKTRMELAKATINDFLKNVPEKANVSLRVYGHKGSGSQEDKAKSCSAIEQVYGFAPYKSGKFQQALNGFEPSGWTPIAAALTQSKKVMKKFGAKNNTNLIYLVSDGIGTCDGDPVQVAKSFSNSKAKPIINIIGYQADAKAQQQLQEMADVSNGVYTTVNNQKGLEEEFNRAEEVLEAWNEWKEDAMRDLDAMSINNEVDITKLTNDWNLKAMQQGNNLVAAISMAEEVGVLTFDQEQKMQNTAHEITDKIKQKDEKIRSNLENISSKNIKKKKKAISERYNKQTQN